MDDTELGVGVLEPPADLPAAGQAEDAVPTEEPQPEPAEQVEEQAEELPPPSVEFVQWWDDLNQEELQEIVQSRDFWDRISKLPQTALSEIYRRVGRRAANKAIRSAAALHERLNNTLAELEKERAAREELELELNRYRKLAEDNQLADDTFQARLKMDLADAREQRGRKQAEQAEQAARELQAAQARVAEKFDRLLAKVGLTDAEQIKADPLLSPFFNLGTQVEGGRLQEFYEDPEGWFEEFSDAVLDWVQARNQQQQQAVQKRTTPSSTPRPGGTAASREEVLMEKINSNRAKPAEIMEYAEMLDKMMFG